MSTYKQAYVLFGIIALVYLIFNIALPADTDVLARFDITQTETRFLKLAVLTPYVLIWFLGVHASVRLKRYVQSLRKGKDGKGLSHIADGIYLLSIGLAASALLTTFRTFIQNRHEAWLPATTIVINFIDLGLTLWAFLLIYKGARLLLGIVKENYHTAYEYLFIGFYMIVGVAFTALSLLNPARQFPTEHVERAAYYMPDFLIIFAIIVPYLFVWYLGFSSAYCVHRYSYRVNGVIYRKALGMLSLGIFLIIIFRILLKFITALATSFQTTDSLQLMLAIIYLLLLTIALGFGLIIRGVTRLKKLEEV